MMIIKRVKDKLIFSPLSDLGAPETEMTLSEFVKGTKVDVKAKNVESSLITTLTPGTIFNALPFLQTEKQVARVCANLLDYFSIRMEKYIIQISCGEVPASVFVVASYCLSYIWGVYNPSRLPWSNSDYYVSANRFCRSLILTVAKARSIPKVGQTARRLISLDSTFHPPKKMRTTDSPWYNAKTNVAKESAIIARIYKLFCGDPLGWTEEFAHFLDCLSRITIIKDSHTTPKTH